MTREEFDRLVEAAVTADLAASPTPSHDDPAAAQSGHEAMQEAQLLEAEARSFADAVDRDAAGRREPIPYGEAVVMEGSQGVAVVSARNYADSPIYWRTVVGRVDRITFGPELIEVLQRSASRATPSGA